jgi:AraC-like DNA-binding protein
MHGYYRRQKDCVMDLTTLAARTCDFIEQKGAMGRYATVVADRFGVLGKTTETQFQTVLYRPIVGMILQGGKEATAGGQTVSYSAGDCLIVAHDLPVSGRVIGATAQAPYLALVARIDIGMLRSLSETLDAGELAEGDVHPLSVAAASDALLDVFARYLALADEPDAQAVLEPLLRRELHYRLLTAPNGGMLRRMMALDSSASRIAKSIRVLQSDFRHPLSVDGLAQAAAMSASSFHRHFKTVTGTTPLQYQKDLRLLEAQRLLSLDAQPIAQIAFDVGYESPTQFSREYARRFGASPKLHRGQVMEVV